MIGIILMKIGTIRGWEIAVHRGQRDVELWKYFTGILDQLLESI